MCVSLQFFQIAGPVLSPHSFQFQFLEWLQQVQLIWWLSHAHLGYSHCKDSPEGTVTTEVVAREGGEISVNISLVVTVDCARDTWPDRVHTESTFHTHTLQHLPIRVTQHGLHPKHGPHGHARVDGGTGGRRSGANHDTPRLCGQEEAVSVLRMEHFPLLFKTGLI